MDPISIGLAAWDIYSSSRKRRKAKQAEGKAEKALALQEERYRKYIEPGERTAIEQMEAEKPTYNRLTNLREKLLGMPGDTELPSYLKTPETSGPEWEKLSRSISGLADLDLEEAAQAETQNMARYAASRGTPISMERSRQLPGFQSRYLPMKQRSMNQRTLMLNDIATQRRSEGLNTLFGVSNLIGGARAPTGYQGVGTTMAGNRAGLYFGQAGEYGAQAEEGLGSVATSLGTLMGSSDFRKQRKQRKPQNQSTGSMVPGGAIAKYGLQTPKSKFTRRRDTERLLQYVY